MLKGFDWVWNVLPPISWYHFFIVTIAGYCGTIDGYSAVYPVFAQFKQPVRCPSELDEDRYATMHLTFSQIVNLTSIHEPIKAFDECLYYDISYTSCPVTDVDQFLNCSSQIPKVTCTIGHL